MKFLNKIFNRNKSKESGDVLSGKGAKETGQGIGDGHSMPGNIGSGTERLPMSVESKPEVVKNVLEVFCPYCASANFVKRGTRQKTKERVQLYLCRDCRRTFTPGAVKGKHYPKATILDAISLYNLGYSLEKACEIVNKMNKV